MAYDKTTWATGDIITAEKLNNIEDGLSGLSTIFSINLEYDMDEEVCTADKTYAQIEEAYRNNCRIEVNSITNYKNNETMGVYLLCFPLREYYEDEEYPENDYFYFGGVAIYDGVLQEISIFIYKNNIVEFDFNEINPINRAYIEFIANGSQYSMNIYDVLHDRPITFEEYDDRSWGFVSASAYEPAFSTNLEAIALGTRRFLVVKPNSLALDGTVSEILFKLFLINDNGEVTVVVPDIQNNHAGE